jgi:hypothetical protein
MLLVGSTLATSQSNSEQMDEWKALLISLRTTKSIQPAKGFVPDEVTAVRIAEAAAIAQFGEDIIKAEAPLKARLYGDVWIVKGTLHPQGAYGGTAVVKLSKVDGKIFLWYTNISRNPAPFANPAVTGRMRYASQNRRCWR